MKKPIRKYLIILGIVIAMFLVHSMQISIPVPKLTGADNHVKERIPMRLNGVINTAVLKYISK